jgi:oligopeptidase B
MVRELHGQRSVDDYAWMRHDKAGLVEYLLAERRHYDAATTHSGPLRATLFEEMSQRVPAVDDSLGWRHGGHVYNMRYVAEKQYPQFCRRAGGDTQVVLDLNELTGGSAYLALGVREMSPDGSLLAYSVDTDGDEVYELRIRDVDSGDDRPDLIPRSYYGCAWSADCAAVVYVVHNEAYRPYRVMRHHLGMPAVDDTLVYEEPDERFHLGLKASRSGEHIVITSTSTNTSEVRLLSTAEIDVDPWLVTPRRDGIEYSVEHVPGADGGDLYIVTNDGAVEFRLMRAPVRGADPEQWVEVCPEDPAERIVAADAFDRYIVLTFRRDGYLLLRTLELATGAVRDHSADIPAGTIRLSCRDDTVEAVRDPFDSDAATVVIESLIEPPSWWSINLATGLRDHLKTAPTPTYESSDYVTTRLTVVADDGSRVPVTLAHHVDVARDGTAPCLLYGYGAYEICIDPHYNPSFASLLDRGVVYAIAHVRGGGERGRNWWLQGRLRHKRNTFTDFITAANWLAEQGWIDGARIASRGASAGGLLVGAALSIAPQRWRAVVAEVPFVDCLTTMLDPTMPLTVGEWEEWGDPRTPGDYEYMASYAPYDNVPIGGRPDLLATGNLHDSRVMVHEPAKWVAKLRATQSDDSTALFRAEAGSSAHFGPSGRYDRLRYQAEISAFVLEKVGATER